MDKFLELKVLFPKTEPGRNRKCEQINCQYYNWVRIKLPENKSPGQMASQVNSTI